MTDPTGKIAPLVALVVGGALIGAGTGIILGATGGALSYALSHPGEDIWHSPGMANAILRGAASGGVAGAITGAIAPLLGPLAGTFWGAVGVGGALGGLGSGVGRIVDNLLNPCVEWYEGVPESVAVGIGGGMVLGGLGYGVRKLWLQRPRSIDPRKLVPNPNDTFSHPRPPEGASPARLHYHREYILQHGKIDTSQGRILVKPIPGGYQIENGHHRWWAAIQAGLKKVPIEILKEILE